MWVGAVCVSGSYKSHVSRFLSSWTRSLVISKCFKTNALLGMVPNPPYLSSPLVFNNVALFASPRSISAVFHHPRTKYTSVFWVWPVIGTLSMKFILLLSSVGLLNRCFFHPHRRNINKSGIPLIKSSISHMHFFWDPKGGGCLFFLVEWGRPKKRCFGGKTEDVCWNGQMDEAVISRLGSTFLGFRLGSHIILSSSDYQSLTAHLTHNANGF